MYLRTKPPSRLTLSRSVLTSGPETRLLGSLDPFSPTSKRIDGYTRYIRIRPSLDRAEKFPDPCKPYLSFSFRKGITRLFGEHLFDFFLGRGEGGGAVNGNYKFLLVYRNFKYIRSVKIRDLQVWGNVVLVFFLFFLFCLSTISRRVDVFIRCSFIHLWRIKARRRAHYRAH